MPEFRLDPCPGQLRVAVPRRVGQSVSCSFTRDHHPPWMVAESRESPIAMSAGRGARRCECPCGPATVREAAHEKRTKTRCA